MMKNKHRTFFWLRFNFLSTYSSFIFFIIVFRLSLDFSYVVFVSPFYENHFLSFPLDVGIKHYLLSWLVFVTLALVVLRHKLTIFSDYFFLSSMIFLIIPLTSNYGMDQSKGIFPVLVTSFSIIFVFIVVRFKKIGMRKCRLSEKNVTVYLKSNRNIIVYLSWSLIIYLMLWLFISGAAGNLNFDLSKVYEYRQVNSDTVNIGILSYINIWTYKIFLNFLVLFYLYKRKFIFVIFLLAIQVLFFGVMSHKAILFIPLLSIGIWYYLSKTNRLVIVPIMFTVVILISVFMYYVLDKSIFAEMFVRRVFFIPSTLTWEWFNFFSNNPHVYWSDKLLSGLIQSPYTLNIPDTIGAHLHKHVFAANNGYVSSAFAHANLWGVLLYSIILGFIVRFLDTLSTSGIPLWLTVALCIEPLRTALTASDLLTSILSHGIIVSIFILLLFRFKKTYYLDDEKKPFHIEL